MDKLPEEIIEQIKKDSIKCYPCTVVLNKNMDNVERYRLGYIAGATAWAHWKAKYDELKAKYDQILVSEDGLSKTEAVFQTGFSSGHDKGHARAIAEHQQLKERAEKLEAAIQKVVGRISGINDTVTNDVVNILIVACGNKSKF